MFTEARHSSLDGARSSILTLFFLPSILCFPSDLTSLCFLTKTVYFSHTYVFHSSIHLGWITLIVFSDQYKISKLPIIQHSQASCPSSLPLWPTYFPHYSFHILDLIPSVCVL